jgi:transposase InsO family protein
MCEQLGVSTSGYYNWRQRKPSAREREDAYLTRLITTFSGKLKGNPGVRRLHAELAAAGHRVSRKRVWRLMQAAGLRGRHPRAWKRTTVPGEAPVPAPDPIGRSFTAQNPNEKWCGDITYVKTWDGWAYVATVIDLHSRRLVGWAIADHVLTSLITDALGRLLSPSQDNGVATTP